MHFAHVAALPCEKLMSAKQAINGVVNNQINKGLLPSLRVKTFLKSLNIWQSYKQEDGCLVHFLRLL